jgi:hypothetical protein
MPTPEQYLFLKSLFSTVGGHMYIENSKMSTDVKHITNRYFQSLSLLVRVVIEDITGTGGGLESVSHRLGMGPISEGKDSGSEGKDSSGGSEEDDDDDCETVIVRQALTTKSIMALESFTGSMDFDED